MKYNIILDGKLIGTLEPPEQKPNWKVMLAIMLLESFVIGVTCGYIWRMIQELI